LISFIILKKVLNSTRHLKRFVKGGKDFLPKEKRREEVGRFSILWGQKEFDVASWEEGSGTGSRLTRIVNKIISSVRDGD